MEGVAIQNLDCDPDGTTKHAMWNSVATLDDDGKYIYSLTEGATNGTVCIHSPRLGRTIQPDDIFACIVVLGNDTNAAKTTLENCTKVETTQVGEHTWLFVGKSTNNGRKNLNTRNLGDIKVLASAMYTSEDYEKILSLSLSLSLSLPYWPCFDKATLPLPSSR